MAMRTKAVSRAVWACLLLSPAFAAAQTKPGSLPSAPPIAPKSEKKASNGTKPDEKPAAKPDEKPAAKPDEKPAARPDEKPAPKPEAKSVARPEEKSAS